MSFDFNETYYLNSKLAQLKALDATTYNGWTTAMVKQAIENVGMTVEEHYHQYSLIEGTSANPYFNTTEYLEAKVNQLNSKAEGGRTNWTVEQVIKAFQDAGFTCAEDHYNMYGCRETDGNGKLINPSNAFDANAYVEAKLAQLQATDPVTWSGKTALDVANAIADAGMTPVDHFEEYGKAESAASGIDMVQTVPVVERVSNDPIRDAMGENVPSNYNPATAAPATVTGATATEVTKPCDMGDAATAKPADPVKVPGDSGYVAPPANVADTNESPVVLVEAAVTNDKGTVLASASEFGKATSTTEGNVTTTTVKPLNEDGTVNESADPIQTTTTNAATGATTTETKLEDANGNTLEVKEETTKAADGSTTTTTTATETNAAGETVASTTTTSGTDANGNSTGSTSTYTDASGAEHTTETDANGNQKSDADNGSGTSGGSGSSDSSNTPDKVVDMTAEYANSTLTVKDGSAGDTVTILVDATNASVKKGSTDVTIDDGTGTAVTNTAAAATIDVSGLLAQAVNVSATAGFVGAPETFKAHTGSKLNITLTDAAKETISIDNGDIQNTVVTKFASGSGSAQDDSVTGTCKIDSMTVKAGTVASAGDGSKYTLTGGEFGGTFADTKMEIGAGATIASGATFSNTAIDVVAGVADVDLSKVTLAADTVLTLGTKATAKITSAQFGQLTSLTGAAAATDYITVTDTLTISKALPTITTAGIHGTGALAVSVASLDLSAQTLAGFTSLDLSATGAQEVTVAGTQLANDVLGTTVKADAADTLVAKTGDVTLTDVKDFAGSLTLTAGTTANLTTTGDAHLKAITGDKATALNLTTSGKSVTVDELTMQASDGVVSIKDAGTVVLTTAKGVKEVNGGAGVQDVTITNNDTALTVDLGAGADVLTLGATHAEAVTINLADGKGNGDSITGFKAAASGDKLAFTTNAVVGTLSAETDGTAVTDELKVTVKNGVATIIGTRADTATAAEIANAISYARNADTNNSDAAGDTYAFENGGNTYVVHFASAAAADALSADDTLVTLVGVTGAAAVSTTAGADTICIGAIV